MPPPSHSIVIVDDHDDIRFLIRHVMEIAFADLQVLGEACDGESALLVLDELDPSLPSIIVLDWMMPGLNGIETSLAIRVGRPDARIIMCSAFGNRRMAQDALDAGIDLVMSKDDLLELPGLVAGLLAS